MAKHIDTSLLDQYLNSLIESKTDIKVIQLLQKTIDRAIKFNNLDHDFIDTLKYVAEHEGSHLFDTDNYSSIVQELAKDSMVIYFKTADLFKVYESDDFDENFLKRIRTNYKKGREIYEVVDDSRPQKILVIIKSDNMEEIIKIKKYIVQFAKHTHPISEDDLMTFNNEISGETEIVINKFYVPNSHARSEFILKLLQFITSKEKNTNISDKMKLSTASPIENTSIVLIPELKRLIDQSLSKETEGYLTKKSPVINININIENMQNIQKANVVQQAAVINNISSDGDDSDGFIEFLRETPPAWYVIGKIVEYDRLYDEYSTFGSLTKKSFTMKYFNLLFTKSKRISKNGKFIQLVKLLDVNV